MKTFLVVLLAASAGAAQAESMAKAPGGLSEAQKLFDAQKYEQVVEALPSTAIDALPSSARSQAYALLGQSYVRKGDVTDALGVLQLAVQLYPKNINLLSSLADLLHGEELDDRAKPLYERILHIHPNNAEANLGLAEIEHTQGFLERSVRHYEQALTERSKDAAIWRSFARVLSERRDYPKAIAAIEKSLSLDPNSAESLEALAVFQYRQGLRREADETIRRAIDAAHGRTDLRLERALWLLQDDELDASLREAQEALRADEGNPLGLWIRGSIALRRGERQAAIRDLKAAGSKPSQYPFISQVSAAMIAKLESAP